MPGNNDRYSRKRAQRQHQKKVWHQTVTFLKDHYSFGSLERICGLFGKGRQAYYEHRWRHEELTLEHEMIIQEVLRIRASLPRIGGRKLLHMLEEFLKMHHIKMGRDQLFDLLREYQLLIRKTGS